LIYTNRYLHNYRIRIL